MKNEENSFAQMITSHLMRSFNYNYDCIFNSNSWERRINDEESNKNTKKL